MSGSATEAVLDQAHNAVVSLDARGRVTYWNPSAERIFGIGREHALGRPVAELIIPERYRAAHTAGLERFLADGHGPMLDRRVELSALRGDGSEFPIEMTITALRDGPEWSFTAFVQDVSERNDAERERDRLVSELQRGLRLSERRFETVVGTLSDPVTIRDRTNTLVYANRAALDHLGFASAEELRQTDPERIMADYLVYGQDGRDLEMGDIPSVRLLRGEQAEPLLIRTVHRRTGEERWDLLKASPLRDENGQIEATIMVIEDVTEQQRRERYAAFLARAGEALASSMDYEQTLRNIAQLAVPEIVDWCAVDLLDAEGERRSVAVAHVDQSRLDLAEQLREYEPASIDKDRGLGYVLSTGEPLLYPEIRDEMLVEAAQTDRHLELLRAVGMRSVALVPMQIGGHTLGAMTFVNADSGRLLDRADVELATQIGARAAVAIENARLYSERSAIAHTLQQSLLPERLPEIEGYELAATYTPGAGGTEVGGDFYDAWEVDGGWTVAIGDVTGRGAGAASVTALVRNTMRAVSDFVTSPAELLARVDRALKRQPASSICTALCLRLEDDRALLAAGGHPLPLLKSAHDVRDLGEHGPLLGGFSGARWRDVELELAPGETLFAYTDGFTDALDQHGRRYGVDRLREVIAESQAASASAVIDSVTRALESFRAGPSTDDTAALAIHRLGVGTAQRWQTHGEPVSKTAIGGSSGEAG